MVNVMWQDCSVSVQNEKDKSYYLKAGYNRYACGNRCGALF